jgi:hypothetical protein
MTAPTKRWLGWIFFVIFGAVVSPMIIVAYWIVGDETMIGSVRWACRGWWKEAKHLPWKERPL